MMYSTKDTSGTHYVAPGLTKVDTPVESTAYCMYMYTGVHVRVTFPLCMRQELWKGCDLSSHTGQQGELGNELDLTCTPLPGF